MELQKRRGIRASLTEWSRLCGFEPARHHAHVIERLEAVARGDIPKLGLFLPPGSAKSTYASVLFPPWYLARDPSRSVIAASHTQELAEHWGRKVRNLVMEHSKVLGYGISEDNKAAGRWETNAGGDYFAAGVGGGIAGRRADLAVIDDPLRSREDADSETNRDKQWEWWKFDLRTRLKPGAGVVLIQTRWHEDDLAGRILNEEAKEWEIVSLPMEALPNDPLGRAVGEPLWPEWYTDDMRATAKRDARLWSALYQQQPTPDTGDYFRAEWFRSVDRLPPLSTMRVYGGSDYAVTSNGGDYTVHAVIGVDPDNRIYLIDLWRKQSASDEWVDAFCDLAVKYRPLAWAEESGQIKSGVGTWLERRMRERQAYVFLEQFPTRGDKAVRAQSIRGRMALDGIYIAKDAPWRADLISECLRFPAGVHDDQVDALGLVGQLLDKMVSGTRPNPAKEQAEQSGYGNRSENRNTDSVLTL
jgi:predicted phage terminase large subunit-like protein